MGRQYALLNYEKTQTTTKQRHYCCDDRVRCGWALFEDEKISFGFGRHIVALPISSLTGNAEIEIQNTSSYVR
jgi:hypothetical protein